MKTKLSRWTKYSAGILCVCLCATLEVGAQQQQQQRPGGGFGGFGGVGGQGGAANRNTSGTSGTSGQQYNPNGGVGSATISVDPDSHNITVIADQDTMESISKVVQNLDRPKPQVLIKVVFLEVQHSDSSDIGVEGGWSHNLGQARTGVVANAFGLSAISSATGSNSPLVNMFNQPLSAFGSIPPGAGLYQMLGSDFQATLRAIAQAGKAQLLSRPSIMARDGQPATIVVGQSVPLITSVSFNTLSGSPINSVTYTDVGIILRVTPFITSDGMVQMIVSPQTSSLDPTTTVPISQGVNAPVIDVRSADTVVVTPDSQTVVIGGLMQNDKASSENKIPILGDIPVLGNLFKRKIKSGTKNELLIFLTPHIIPAPTELVAMTSEEKRHMLTPHSYSEEELDRFLDKMPTKKPSADGKHN